MQLQHFWRVGLSLVASGALTLGCSAEPVQEAQTTGGTSGTGGGTAGTGAAAGSGANAGAGMGGSSAGTSAGGSAGATAGMGGASGSSTAGGGAGGTSGAGGSSAGAAPGGSGGAGNMGGRAGGGAGGMAGASGASGQPMGGAGGAGGGGNGDTDPSTGCGMMGAPQSGASTISVDGTSRQYTLRVPDNYDANHPYRLIFSFHWLNGTMQNIANGSGTAAAYYGLWDLAEGSTIFVAPQGINNGWSDSGRSAMSGGQDIKFTQALYDRLESSLCIDKSRVFAEGFSMGGSMSYAVACALPNLFRAVAAHSGGPMSGCVQHDEPVAYFMTHGTNDSVCTYPQYGVPQLNDFAEINGCQAATLPTPNSAQGACIDFQGCMAGYPTRACIFVGDHTPSPPNVNSTWVPEETWNFFKQF